MICTKREWDKAVKKLKEMAGNNPSSLDYSEWVTGMNALSSRYTAYIEAIGMTSGETALEAVEELARRRPL